LDHLLRRREPEHPGIGAVSLVHGHVADGPADLTDRVAARHLDDTVIAHVEGETLDEVIVGPGALAEAHADQSGRFGDDRGRRVEHRRYAAAPPTPRSAVSRASRGFTLTSSAIHAALTRWSAATRAGTDRRPARARSAGSWSAWTRSATGAPVARQSASR